MEKKKFSIKIGGFEVGLKVLVPLVIIALLIVVVSCMNKAKDDKEAQRQKEEAESKMQAVIDAAQGSSTDDTTLGYESYDLHAEIQKSLVEQFGVAPDGFEWDYSGNLVALGNDDSANCEDVVYLFVRSLSMLDFSTAERYSMDSQTISAYKDYYSEFSDAITNYYSNFLRKQFKTALTRIEINAVQDKAIFADGTEYVTLSLSVLDLTDKDFWKDDKEDLFETMRIYYKTENDDTKSRQYVYDYVYDKYETGVIGKRNVTVELVVTKQNGGGWLVTGDGELTAVLQYEQGVDVANYIIVEFQQWNMQKDLDEMMNSSFGDEEVG